MKSNAFSNWWVLTFNGIIALLFGLMAIFSPIDTLKVIVMYFGIIMLIVGVSMFFGVYNNIRNRRNYTSDLISSLITFGLGIVLTFFTQRSVEIFVIVIGIWAIILGISQLVIMMNIQSAADKRMLLINGIITLGFGILLFFIPFETASIFVILIGILALVIGVILIALSIKLKSLQ
jgi:uncharacterized membrane protein HdeD (DUF308 family)